MLKVGKKAPEFKMKAYHQGVFKEIALSDYAGKWLAADQASSLKAIITLSPG